jgi:D-3-phosphoglycerate dehydrogenase
LILSTNKLNDTCVNLLQEWDLKNGIYDQNDISKAEVLITWPNVVEGLLGKGLKNLQVIQTLSAGVDDLPFNLLPENVKLFSNAGGYSQSVSEHAMALILSLAKNVNHRDRPDSYWIAGKTLVMLGGGGIGSTVAKMARSVFQCKIIGVSRSFKDPNQFDERVGIDQLDNAIASADYVVCALPLNKFTKNLLNYKSLSSAKNRCVIANVGRAEAINEADMIRILTERPDFRFATDVFWRTGYTENFDSKLWTLPNFMGTLHRAGASASQEVKDRAAEAAVRNLKAFLETGKARNVVDRNDYV